MPLCPQPCVSYGQTASESAESVIRKAVQNFSSRVDHTKNYAYLEVVGQRYGPHRPNFNIYENMLVNGKPLRRHIRYNSKPIPIEDDDQERDKLRNVDCVSGEFKVSADKVEKTTAVNESSDPQVADRRQSCLEHRKLSLDLGLTNNGCSATFVTRRLRDLRLPIEALGTGFELKVTGTEEPDGRPNTVIDATPIPRADHGAGDLGNFKLKIWIDEEEYEFAKIEGTAIESRLLSTADYFSVQFRKTLSDKLIEAIRQSLPKATLKYSNTTILLQWRKVNGEAWLPTEIRIHGDEIHNVPYCKRHDVYFPFPLGIPLNTETYVMFGEYKKFRAETRIIGIDE